MKKLLPFIPALVVIVLLVAATTMEDFFLPGSQIGQSGNIETPDRCDNCHGGYDLNIEPAFNWRGSMMAQAARDPLFYACLAIANQDAPGSGDMCLRCHTPDGWLNGRCVPTDGSALNNNDRQGVQCDFCHKMVKPLQKDAAGKFINPYPNDLLYTSTVFGNVAYNLDQAYLTTILPIPGTSANGMYLADANNAKRGPFSDATGRHQMIYSPFHHDAAHCGTCHDVSNPAFSKTTSFDEHGNPVYALNVENAPHENFDLRYMFPVERTYSEWQASGYANKTFAEGGRTCQDCHMKDVNGKAASMKDAKLRSDMPLHDFTGGNTFTPEMIKDGKWSAEVNHAALDAGIKRARLQLQSAADFILTVDNETTPTKATVKVVNKTGHKLPTGYPEGRRMWINLVAYGADGAPIGEYGKYNPDENSTAPSLAHDTKIYECEPGNPNEPSFHFAVNNKVHKDNRIPPAGYNPDKMKEYQSPVIGATYAANQNWDITEFELPTGTKRIEAKLLYQTTTREYVKFLRDNNTTNSAGQELWDLWMANGKGAPETMNSATWGTGGTPVLPAMNAAFVSVDRTGTKSVSGRAVIKVTGLDGKGISGALVQADYSGPTTGSISGTTGTTGEVTLLSKSVRNPAGSWCFRIINVTHSQFTYVVPKPFTSLCETLKSADIPQQLAFENSLTIYPNPVPGKARLSYSVAEPGMVRIAVYNNLGQQVSLLANRYTEEGEYTAEWDGTRLPDGIYHCRMTTGMSTLTKTIILQK